MKLPFARQFERLSWSLILLAIALVLLGALLLDYFEQNLIPTLAILAVTGSVFFAGFRYIRERWIVGHPTPNFKTLAETTAAGIIVYRGEDILYANEQATALSGYSFAELRQLRLWDLVHPDYRNEARSRAQQRLAGTRPRERYEIKVVTKPGEQRWFEVAADGIDFDGERAGLVTAYDITARKLADAAARQAINDEQSARKETEAARQRLSNVLECISDAFFAVTPDKRLLYINAQATDMTGLQLDAVIGKPLATVFPPEVCESFVAALDRAIETREPNKHEHYFADWQRWFEVCIYPAQDCVSIFFNELTEQRRADAALRESEARFRALFAQAAVGLALVRPDGHPTLVNDKLCEILGYPREQLLERGFAVLADVPDYTLFAAHLEQLLAGAIGDFTLQQRFRGANGETRWATVTVSLAAEGAHAREMIYVIEDITARKLAEERLSYIATHDTLTGLPTRSLFLDRLQRTCDAAVRSGALVAVVLLNLRRFKQINETLGLVAGDALLQLAAARLSRTGASNVARLGGDEYALAFSANDESDVALKVQSILDRFAQPFTLEQQSLFVSATSGIAVYPSDGESAETLLRNAAVALHRNRAQGGMTFNFYAAEMNARAYERLTLEQAMHHALERNEFVIHYQPQVSPDGRLLALEALLRWQHPELGLLLPGEFVPIAEESGFIAAIGTWVIRTVCQQHLTWRAAGMPPVTVAVNVSPQQFALPLAEEVSRILLETRVTGSVLEFEITETVLMRNAEATLNTLRALASQGIRFAIDDFGTGYSSLSYLKRFPIEVLKIDRSFVTGIPDDRNDVGIASAIIAMGHQLGMRVIAEGVENAAQRSFLLEHGCDGIQGFLYSAAVDAAHAERWLAASSPFA